MRMPLALALFLGAIAPSVSSAQPVPGSYGPGRNMGPPALLRNKSVHKELKATPEQARKLEDLADAVLKDAHDRALKDRDLPPERRQTALDRQRVYHEFLRKSLDDILKPEQARRFYQIFVQQGGASAFQLPHVEQALKLTKHQETQLQVIRLERNDLLRDAGPDVENDPKRFSAAVLAVNAQMLAKSLAILNDEQKATWNDLYGEPFLVVIE